MAQPAVTVCVSTRNRSHLLPRLLEHLEAQTLGAAAFEAVIVDDGSSDDTWDVLTALAAASPLRLRIHRNEPALGAAAGRNRAWRDATAPICAFTDDDCMPAPHWLAAVVAGMTDRNTVAAGRVIWPPADDALMAPFSRTVTQGAHNAQWGATANLIARTADLETVGGFDEGFLDVAIEDTDLVMRILSTGADFSYLHDALVYHPIETGGLRALVRQQRRWVDIPGVIAKHPQARDALLYRGYFWRPIHLRALLAVLGLVALPKHRGAVLLVAPWIHDRVCRPWFPFSPTERIVTLPGAFVLDLAEIWTMARGSARHKALVL